MFGMPMPPQALPRTMAPQTPGGIANLTGTPMMPNRIPQAQGPMGNMGGGPPRQSNDFMKYYKQQMARGNQMPSMGPRDAAPPGGYGAGNIGPRTMTGSPVRDITPPMGYGMADIGPRSVPTPVMGAPSPLPRDPMLSQQMAGAGPMNQAITTGFGTGMTTAPNAPMFGSPRDPMIGMYGQPMQQAMDGGMGAMSAYQQFMGQPAAPQIAPPAPQPMGMAQGGMVGGYDDYLMRLRGMR